MFEAEIGVIILENNFEQKITGKNRQGNCHIIYTKKNENNLKSKNKTSKNKKISEKKDDGFSDRAVFTTDDQQIS